MTRLLATVRVDVRVQFRNGFYYAVIFVLLCWFVLLSQLPEVDWGYVLPAVIFGNVTMVSFYFMAGLVLLEKGEGTLEAQVVTPLADWEYLVSKIATLAALSLVEHLVIVGSAYGLDFGVVTLVGGVVIAAVLYTLVGFIAVARYDSINEYLFPSAFFLAALSLPLLHYFGLWETPLMYLHPFQAPLVLLTGAFGRLDMWEWVYAVAYSVVWMAILFRLNQRAFSRFIVAGEGIR